MKNENEPRKHEPLVLLELLRVLKSRQTDALAEAMVTRGLIFETGRSVPLLDLPGSEELTTQLIGELESVHAAALDLATALDRPVGCVEALIQYARHVREAAGGNVTEGA